MMCMRIVIGVGIGTSSHRQKVNNVIILFKWSSGVDEMGVASDRAQQLLLEPGKSVLTLNESTSVTSRSFFSSNISS